MKWNVILICFSAALILSFTSCSDMTAKHSDSVPLNILVITGGHDFDPDFFKVFESFENINFDTLSQPAANRMYDSSLTNRYQALVFYDMTQEITEAERNSFISMLRKGMGIVFLHHSIVSYQNWDLFHDILGGKYYEKGFPGGSPPSTYKHGLDLDIHIADTSHPVTRGLSDFSIHDEGYGKILVHNYVHTLLTTHHADCSEKIAWTNSFGNSRIVYIMLGHDAIAFRNPSFRKLVENAIRWSSAGHEQKTP